MGIRQHPVTTHKGRLNGIGISHAAAIAAKEIDFVDVPEQSAEDIWKLNPVLVSIRRGYYYG